MCRRKAIATWKRHIHSAVTRQFSSRSCVSTTKHGLRQHSKPDTPAESGAGLAHQVGRSVKQMLPGSF